MKEIKKSNKKKPSRRGGFRHSRPIIELTTGMKFKSMVEAGKYFGISTTTIHNYAFNKIPKSQFTYKFRLL